MKTILLLILFFILPYSLEAQERQPTIFSESAPTLTVLAHGTVGNANFIPGAKAAGFSIWFEGPAGGGRFPRTSFLVGLRVDAPWTYFSTGQSANLRSGSITLNLGWKFRLGD